MLLLAAEEDELTHRARMHTFSPARQHAAASETYARCPAVAQQKGCYCMNDHNVFSGFSGRRLLRCVLGCLLLGHWSLFVASSWAQHTEALTELQNKYNAALQEIIHLREELEQARREIARLQHDRESAVTPPAQESSPALEERHYLEVIAALTKSIEANPQDATLYRNRGMAYTQLGNYEQALQDLHKAIKLEPRDAIAYNQRGIVYYQTGKYQQAIEDFGKAIERQSELAEAYQNRGITLRKLGNYSQAIQDLRKAAQLGLDSASQYLQVLRSEVQYAQERLQKVGFDPGPADGLPGQQTLTALRAFQRSQGLPNTGFLDEATKQALGFQAGVPATAQSPPGDAPPQFMHQPKPEYPLLARQNGWEGTTTLRFELLADGTIGQVEIARSSGYPVLDTAAQAAIKQWTHKPVTREGVSVTRWTSLQVNFTLDKTPEPGR